MIDSIHPIPAFSDNYIWALADTESRNVCVVDPGDAQAVIDYLAAENLSLSDILITHHHPDHTGGIALLSSRFSTRVIGPKTSNIAGITEFVSEGDEFTLFAHAFKVFAVPGHTLDHIAFYSEAASSDPILFCGDTLFAAGCGRLFEGSPENMHKSLSKLSCLPATTQVYCTHEYTMANLAFASAAEPGNQKLQQRVQQEQEKRDSNQPTLPSNIELERLTNPFLRCSETEIQNCVEARLGRKPENEVEVFSALRSWKDNF